MSDHTLYTLWILLAGGQCSARTYKMLSCYESAQQAYLAAKEDQLDRAVFSQEDCQKFQADFSLEEALRIVEYCDKKHIKIITYYDPEYPPGLKRIACPPLALFIRGTLPDTENTPSITIVGTRNCSQRAQQFTAKLSYGLARSGFQIVSGLANGIDTYAHKGCLMAKTTQTIAVLPCSIDRVYPVENTQLSDLIEQNGAVISELLPGSNIPGKWSFLLRNRILSALTQGTLVVETAKKGGSLITANHALEQNKWVFAVPGFPGTPTSEGTNELIKSGAICCTGLNDIYDAYQPLFGAHIHRLEPQEHQKSHQQKSTPKCNEKQKRVLSVLEQPRTADEVCQKTDFPFFEAVEILQQLELMDLIEQTAGGYYKTKN